MSEATLPPLAAVEHVDLDRYMGKWYEIARYPNWFQKDCASGSSATYTKMEDGTIDVCNECVAADGAARSMKGKMWSADPKGNAKLKVRFFWPFTGDVWILALGRDYEYAVVGHPSRRSLWILARTPQISEELYAELVEKIRGMHFDVEKLQRTPQRQNLQ